MAKHTPDCQSSYCKGCADQQPEPEKKQVGTIDLTPTWQGLMPTIITLLRHGNAEGHKHATAELMRLARFADDHIAKSKVK